jgi:DNA phosphorothioation-associated DGQHR protein 1
MSNKFEKNAIKITQPLGTFYVFKMKASDLKLVSYSSRAKYKKSGFLNNVFSPISGTQRELLDKRGNEISRYINSVECAMPNSIVLGANISEDGDLIEDEDKWYVEEDALGNCKLIIPTSRELASIIDGQHRLAGCMASERQDLELLCAVYLGLPLPYQAYLFASINANQKKVARSLAYELYGFGSDNEDRVLWSPEKLAVSLARKLNFDDESLIKGKIILGAQTADEQGGYLSLASLVDSILQLVTGNPKKDRDVILHYRNKEGRKSLEPNLKIPLRQLYIDGNDQEINRIVFEFLNFIFKDIHFDSKSYLYKTIGVQSLFSLLKKYLIKESGQFKIATFENFCAPIWNIDFAVDFFTASGIGKSRIFNTLQVSTGLLSVEDVKNKDDAKKISELIKLSQSK